MQSARKLDIGHLLNNEDEEKLEQYYREKYASATSSRCVCVVVGMEYVSMLIDCQCCSYDESSEQTGEIQQQRLLPGVK